MSLEKSLEKTVESPLGLLIVVGGAIAVLYLGYRAVKGAAGAAVDGAAGLVTGNNPITDGTAYQGDGIAGTLGAAANKASGGALQSIGDWLGGKIYDLTHPASAAAPKGASTAPATVSQMNLTFSDGGGW